MKTGIIYCATFANGKRYVGQTQQTFRRRIQQHRRGGCRLFARALAKHGEPEWRVLAVVGADFLDDVERFYIAELSPELNLTAGGEGGIPSAETRARIGAANRRRKHGTAAREKVRAFHTGRKRSPQTCANISAAKTGRPNGLAGRVMPPEHRAKISAAQKRHQARIRQRKTGMLL